MATSCRWRFALVTLVFASLAAIAIGWGIVRFPAQAQMLMKVMDTQLGILEGHLATFGIDLFGPGGRQDLSHLIADPGRLFAALDANSHHPRWRG